MVVSSFSFIRPQLHTSSFTPSSRLSISATLSCSDIYLSNHLAAAQHPRKCPWYSLLDEETLKLRIILKLCKYFATLNSLSGSEERVLLSSSCHRESDDGDLGWKGWQSKRISISCFMILNWSRPFVPPLL